jgi:hypothetical protein
VSQSQARKWILGLAVSAIAIFLALCRPGSGQQASQPQIYNPYPPGIVPPDVETEVQRVSRETRKIEEEALQEWANLPAPNPQGNPLTKSPIVR